MCGAFRVVCGIALFYCLLKKRGGVGIDDDSSIGFEVVHRLPNGYGVVVENRRGHGNEAQMGGVRFGHRFGGLNDGWSYYSTFALVRRDLPIKIDDVNYQGWEILWDVEEHAIEEAEHEQDEGREDQN